MQLGHLGDQAAVCLLWEGVIEVVGAQTRLHMAHGDLVVEGGEGGGKGGGGVALHQHQVGAVFGKFQTQALQGRTGHVGEGLARGHQGQVLVRAQLEERHHLGHHFLVLAREHHPGLK